MAPLPSSPATVTAQHLDDIEASVLIVGGGPHALAVLSSLHERSLAYPQFGLDAMSAHGMGFNSLQKTGSVCVMDPGHHFCDEWNTRFEALEIDHLRSPAFAHPRAYEPEALMNFAVSQGREHELLNVPAASYRHAMDENLGSQPTLFSQPTSALFRDFCASLEAGLDHQWVRGRAVQVRRDLSTGKFRVRYTNGSVSGWVAADAVVLATGPAGKLNIPVPFTPFVDSGCVTHTAEFVRNGKTVASMVTQIAGDTGDTRLLVIGGGLTAAQAALAAAAAGSRVVLRSRRPLMTRKYDLSKDWLDHRVVARLLAEFHTTPVAERLQMVKEEVGGGSVPESYMKELHRVASGTSGRLELQVSETVGCSAVTVQEDGKVRVDGDIFDHVILATGSSSAPGLNPLYRQVAAEFQLPTVDNLPVLDDELRWMDGGNLHVVGANAVLELGPGALNLMGAQRGAKIVAGALRDLMWTGGKAASAAGIAAHNKFSLLGLDSDDDSDDDDSDDDDGEREERAAAKSSSQRDPPPT